MDDPRARVASFCATHELDAPPAYRLLDLVSEAGEVTREATTSTGYGAEPDAIDLSTDEIGDVYFSLLSLASAADVDAEAALAGAMEKYEAHLDERGSPGSGE